MSCGFFELEIRSVYIAQVRGEAIPLHRKSSTHHLLLVFSEGKGETLHLVCATEWQLSSQGGRITKQRFVALVVARCRRRVELKLKPLPSKTSMLARCERNISIAAQRRLALVGGLR
ncbi:MAG: hypothetical protein IT291_03055 [Deltaproteobacteria bacterium]|nr:hypothetical protein [Deltaproteobacteria bacterium]